MKSIITKKGARSGQTIAIFAGIHGNERAGIEALKIAIETIEPESGTVHFVFGNIKAIAKNARYTETNLNRDFIRTDKPQSYEQKRAQELMDILDNCDALLDLHAYSEPHGEATPFCICESHCFEITKKLPVEKIISNITSFQDGSTNGYMDSQNKIGIVVELGAIETPDSYVSLGLECINIFLDHFQTICTSTTSKEIEQEYLSVIGVHRKNTDNFSFSRQRKSFDKILEGEMIAQDGPLEIRAKTSGQILFPIPNLPSRVECFWFLSQTDPDIY